MVEGSVTALGYDKAYGVVVSGGDGSTVELRGPVQAVADLESGEAKATGVKVRSNGERVDVAIRQGAEARAGGRATGVDIENVGDGSTVAINGTVKVEGNRATGISVDGEDDSAVQIGAGVDVKGGQEALGVLVDIDDNGVVEIVGGVAATAAAGEDAGSSTATALKVSVGGTANVQILDAVQATAAALAEGIWVSLSAESTLNVDGDIVATATGEDGQAYGVVVHGHFPGQKAEGENGALQPSTVIKLNGTITVSGGPRTAGVDLNGVSDDSFGRIENYATINAQGEGWFAVNGAETLADFWLINHGNILGHVWLGDGNSYLVLAADSSVHGNIQLGAGDENIAYLMAGMRLEGKP
ncbi:MAG TPA: hypothetical protein VKZ69_02350 [Limnochordales bacterium]|nr:hypothetical protein [Limnochordales bacterium]